MKKFHNLCLQGSGWGRKMMMQRLLFLFPLKNNKRFFAENEREKNAKFFHGRGAKGVSVT
ncbi:MAG: hypothetical protein BM485_16690 [Desulfobulbaceae bacterium DB1]|nr:MAG: hypothetical protein BM485_16690 [Desulfobulbaceae bacterium DB1]